MEYPFGDADLDGDGWTDLLLGAPGLGRVGILSAPPAGEHLVWDIAAATLEVPISVGSWLDAGDLDQDGTPEVLVGAPHEAPGGVLYILRGPFEGSRDMGTAEWSIHGDVPLDLTGISMVIADLDGDDNPDLAVSQPGNGFAGDEGGRVLLFAGPLAQGAYPATEADVVLLSNGTGAGEFGSGIEAGDLDGDGADDLAITAWLDEDAAGHPVGSLQLFYGGADLFP